MVSAKNAGGEEVWLAVETASRVGSVAVWRDGLALECSLSLQRTHSERVLPAVERALEAAGTSPDQVTAFVVGSGPGSFTGVRIAASLAKGWTMARSTTLFAYSSLLAVAAGSGASGPVCPVFDARRDEVYAACYSVSAEGPEALMAPGAWKISELIEALLQQGLAPTFVGEGALKHSEMLTARLEGARLLPPHLGVPRAGSLLWLRSVAPELGRVERPETWEPVYAREWRVVEEGERS